MMPQAATRPRGAEKRGSAAKDVAFCRVWALARSERAWLTGSMTMVHVLVFAVVLFSFGAELGGLNSDLMLVFECLSLVCWRLSRGSRRDCWLRGGFGSGLGVSCWCIGWSDAHGKALVL